MTIQRREAFVYACATLLMFVRVDLWWWGEHARPVLFGWLTVPMLYQLGIWFVGWMLVLYTVKYVWVDD